MTILTYYQNVFTDRKTKNILSTINRKNMFEKKRKKSFL